MVLTDLRSQMLSLQRELTGSALGSNDDDPLAAVDTFLEARSELIGRIRNLQPEILLSPSATALTVVTHALMQLRPTS